MKEVIIVLHKDDEMSSVEVTKLINQMRMDGHFEAMKRVKELFDQGVNPQLITVTSGVAMNNTPFKVLHEDELVTIS